MKLVEHELNKFHTVDEDQFKMLEQYTIGFSFSDVSTATSCKCQFCKSKADYP